MHLKIIAFLEDKRGQYSQGQKRVVHCTSTNAEKKVNAAYLIGSYCIIYLKIHPAEVTKLLMKAGPYKQFMDASQIPCPFTIKLEFCFNAISKAVAFNFFNFDDFDVTEYDMYEKLQFGDMNWLVPRKFLAFIGPNSSEFLNGHPPDYYIKYFLKNDIKTVIRLNNKMYDAAVFSNAGIAHYDLIYPDGSTPSKDILMKFLLIAETAPAAVAVHCKAGLGRTGSLIGAYIIKHYRMSAKEAIAWMRICRPGSVIGQQQVWLEKLESWLWNCGTIYRNKHYGEGEKIPRHKFGIYSKIWPVERNRILREARRKYSSQYSVSDPEHLAQTNKKLSTAIMRSKPPYFRSRMKNIKEGNCFEDISELLRTVYGLEKNKSRQHNRTMPNIRASAGSESRRHTATPIRIFGSQMQRRTTAEDVANDQSTSTLLQKSRMPETESQGDNQYTERSEEDRSSMKNKSGPVVVQVPARRKNVFKVDTDTDTSNYVHSYMEEKARRKALSGKIKVTQGDKLLERKVIKSGNIVRLRKPSGSIVNSNNGHTAESDFNSTANLDANSYVYSDHQ
ncbi:uncharacterized protein LOC123307553 isoform X2 [Coccinella septempunctata]|uniref:uncharacterized protein LOC123307553 isoform X2 n=1 Tax=Coccinella septempunctata TaxID=41139 RepID=UPI001D080C77|nr:uncharacterized protein LOC123307553 isoform X2 [Coccinella septempunctata]